MIKFNTNNGHHWDQQNCPFNEAKYPLLRGHLYQNGTRSVPSSEVSLVVRCPL